MIDFGERSSARRWVFPMLVLFLVLGHACDLPAYVDVISASHTTEKSPPSGDGHRSDEQALSCDLVSATSSPSHSWVAAAPEIISLVLQVNDPAPASMVARAFEGPAKLAFRLALFLLHASFLI